MTEEEEQVSVSEVYASWSEVFGLSVDSRCMLGFTSYARSQGRGGAWMVNMTENGPYAEIVARFRDAVTAALPDGLALVGEWFTGPTGSRPADLFTTIRVALGRVKLMDIIAAHDPVRLAATPEWKQGDRVYVRGIGDDSPSGNGTVQWTGLDGIGGDIAGVRLDTLPQGRYGALGETDGSGQSRRLVTAGFEQLRPERREYS